MKAHITEVRVVTESDVDPDVSYIGEYTDTASDWAICRHCGEYLSLCGEEHEIPDKGREYRFFIPYAGGEKPGTKEYITYGKQDFSRMESLQNGGWCFLGIVAKATVVIGGVCQTIRSGGLWGIESDSEDSYIESVVSEELSELGAQLSAIGLGNRAIEHAMKNAIRE